MGRVFISHASEDKDTFVRLLAQALRSQGLAVWYDEYTLKPGDSLRRSINSGLSGADCGIVVLSEAFFSKGWTQYELDVLHSRRMQGEALRIIPVWFKVGIDEVREQAPDLSTIIGIPCRGVDELEHVVDRIHDAVPELWPSPTDKNRLGTGCAVLDRLLGGGFPRPSSVALIGPEGVGKTLLAIQILRTALQSELPGMFITYKESPVDVYRWMQARGIDVGREASGNRLRIFDAFSARHSISENEIRAALPAEAQQALVYVVDPRDVDEYADLQNDIHQSIGFGGVNIVDSVNDRMRLFAQERNPVEAATTYFLRMRTRLSRMGGQSAIHIQDERMPDEFRAVLRGRQDGSIIMRRNRMRHGLVKQLRVSHLRNRSPDSRWHEFIIDDTSVSVIRKQTRRGK